MIGLTYASKRYPFIFLFTITLSVITYIYVKTSVICDKVRYLLFYNFYKSALTK